MFHWICPECGREIPPKLKECPSCDPQSTPVVQVADAVVHVPDAVLKDAGEAVVAEALVKEGQQAATEEPAPVGTVPADVALIPVADSAAPTLKEIAILVESAAAAADTVAGRSVTVPEAVAAAIQAPLTAANTIERADPAGRTVTDRAVTDEPAADQRVAHEPAGVDPETTRVSVEAAAAPITDSGDERQSQSVAQASPESVTETPTAIAVSVHSTPAADHPESEAAGHLEPSMVESAGQGPPTEHADFNAAAPTELPADLLATRRLAIPPLPIRQHDTAVAEFPERQAQLPLSPSAPPDPARDPLLALAQQIRDAQSQPTLSFTDSPPVSEPAHVPQTEQVQASTDVAPEDIAPEYVRPPDAAPDEPAWEAAAPEPPPIPDELVAAATTDTVTVAGTPTSEPSSCAKPEDADTEEIFLPPVLARLAASIGISELRPTTPEPASPASVSNASASTAHDTENDTAQVAEPVAQSSPASVAEPVPVFQTTGPLELTSRHIESISPTESDLQIESAHTQVETEYAHVGQLALLTDSGPLALLGNALISVPPEAAPVPLETPAIQAPPEPVASSAQASTQFAAPHPQIAGPVSPDDSSSGKAPSGSWLQLAPLQDYSAATAHSMQPVPLAAKILTPDSGPRMTLPGPTLPPELARFQNANLVTVIGDASRTGKFRVPGWAVSFLVMLALLVIGVGVVFYFLPVAHSSAETQAPALEGHGNASQPATPTPLASQPVVQPLAQFVEVTGFRIVVDFNKKSEIHYLVVNHSGANLSDVTVYVTLRTASAKPGQPPICRFSFRAPSLGPFESKEMTSSIEKLTRSTTLPDWQDLRPEVQIAQ